MASDKIVLSNSSGLVNNNIPQTCSRPAFLHRVRNIMCNRQPARKAIKRMTHARRQALRYLYFGRDMVHKAFDNHTFFRPGFIVTLYRHFLSSLSFIYKQPFGHNTTIFFVRMYIRNHLSKKGLFPKKFRVFHACGFSYKKLLSFRNAYTDHITSIRSANDDDTFISFVAAFKKNHAKLKRFRSI